MLISVWSREASGRCAMCAGGEEGGWRLVSFAFWNDDSGCGLEAGRGEGGGECGNLLGMQPCPLEETGPSSGAEQWPWVSRFDN